MGSFLARSLTYVSVPGAVCFMFSALAIYTGVRAKYGVVIDIDIVIVIVVMDDNEF